MPEQTSAEPRFDPNILRLEWAKDEKKAPVAFLSIKVDADGRILGMEWIAISGQPSHLCPLAAYKFGLRQVAPPDKT